MLTGGGGQTPGCQKNTLRCEDGDPTRAGCKTFGWKEFSPLFVAHLHRTNPPFLTFQDPFSLYKKLTNELKGRQMSIQDSQLISGWLSFGP